MNAGHKTLAVGIVRQVFAAVVLAVVVVELVLMELDMDEVVVGTDVDAVLVVGGTVRSRGVVVPMSPIANIEVVELIDAVYVPLLLWETELVASPDDMVDSILLELAASPDDMIDSILFKLAC